MLILLVATIYFFYQYVTKFNILSLVLTIISLFLVPSNIFAQYYNGYINSDGYKYWDGYWYYGQGYDAYTRTLYQNPGYYNYGIYYPGSTYYRYSYSHTYKAPLSYKNPDWRSQLLNIAAQRDKVEGQIRKDAFEQAYFSQSVKQLGLEGNFNWQAYGMSPPYPNNLNQGYNLNQQLPLASTIMGYSQTNVSQMYGDLNVNQVMQQAFRLGEQANNNAAAGTQSFMSLASQAGTNQNKVAEILAKGQAVQAMLQAINEPSAKFQQIKTEFKIIPNKQNGQLNLERPVIIQKIEGNDIDPQVKTNLKLELDALIQSQCVSCHSGDEPKGKFNITNYYDLTPEEKTHVWIRLLTPDKNKIMPRNPDGTPGKPLTLDQVRLFMYN